MPLGTAPDTNPREGKQTLQPFWTKAAQTAMDRGYSKITVQTGSGVVGSATVLDGATKDAKASAR